MPRLPYLLNLTVFQRTFCLARTLAVAFFMGTLSLIPIACSPGGSAPLVIAPQDAPTTDSIVVNGRREWTDTGINLRPGQSISVSATGLVQIGKLSATPDGAEREVGPQGTYHYSDSLVGQPFPLPAAGAGPAPCFCLIGRIGEAEPFFVGQHCSFTSQHSGRLYLGINDYQVQGNMGEFYADISFPTEVQPVEYRTHIPAGGEVGGGPAENCKVVVFYIDGLRPDVVEEMAAMGHVPNLRKHFVDGGTHLCNAFTAFPSDTITSNGTMWTGCFSDRHGLKGQVRFSRHRRNSDSFLEPMGPGRSSRQLDKHGIDKLLHTGELAAIRTLNGKEAEEHWRASRASQTPALYNHLQDSGDDWATGVLPIMTQTPPLLWTRSLARCLPYFQTQQAWRYIDDANTHYALRHLLSQDRAVTVIWLPETDSVSHKECRGQFGSTRRTIARADQLVGEVTAALEASGELDHTYLILVSDHGHLGGQTTHLSQFDLAHEVFFHSREVSPTRGFVGGGLGMSVRQHRFSNFHTGDNERDFVFIDGDSDGAARIYLPRGGYRSRNWTGPNSAAELLAYPVAESIPSVNLPEFIAQTKARHDDGTVRFPIDLVLMKLSPESILITTSDRGQAVIDRRQNEDGRWFYRYTPVENVAPADNGQVAFDVMKRPTVDPLNLLDRVPPKFLSQFHDETTWLYVTASSTYPDAVVTLTRHMLWQESIVDQEQEYAPDLVVTARHGWLIGTQGTPGTTHGYPLAESVRATFYVSGPNVRRGARVQAPCRLADLTPTILHLTGTQYDETELDGRPLRNLFETGERIAASEIQQASASDLNRPHERPRYWREIDLHAWRSLQYNPANPYGDLPSTVNNPNSGWDLNNIAYNAMTIGDWSIFRMVDDVATAATPGTTNVTSRVESIEQTAPTRTSRPWMGTGIQALDIPGVSVSDYSMTSTGNLHRADKTLDWLQDRSESINNRVARRLKKKNPTPIPYLNRGIDGVQYGFWEAYRFGQRIAAEILDETILNGIENRIDDVLNSNRDIPSEVEVP